MTDPLYGFKLGLSMQTSGNPFSLEQNEGACLVAIDALATSCCPKRILKYLIGETDVKAGRQYTQMPLAAGNYSRTFKAFFESVTNSNKNIPKNRNFRRPVL